MVLNIPVVGLPGKIRSIPEGSLILLQGRMDAIPSFLSQLIGHEAWKNGRTVTLITSKTSEQVMQQTRRIEKEHVPYYIVEKTKPDEWSRFITNHSVLIIDSFLFLSMETDKWVYKTILEDMKEKCVKTDSIIILVGREGMLDEQKDYILSHLSDGIVYFRSRETEEGISRYMRVPKWVDGEPVDMYIFYNYSNNLLSIDSRSRVV